MRLWTLHPSYLDPQGLVALWREALLARMVLHGRTRGYCHHPQLLRFRAHPDPCLAIDAYLYGVFCKSAVRGYKFNPNKVAAAQVSEPISVTSSQLAFEWQHLRGKLHYRSPEWFKRWIHVPKPRPHPLFRVMPGPVEKWEQSSVPRRQSARRNSRR